MLSEEYEVLAREELLLLHDDTVVTNISDYGIYYESSETSNLELVSWWKSKELETMSTFTSRDFHLPNVIKGGNDYFLMRLKDLFISFFVLLKEFLNVMLL